MIEDVQHPDESHSTNERISGNEGEAPDATEDHPEESEVARLRKRLTEVRSKAKDAKERLDDLMDEQDATYDRWIGEESRRSGSASLALRALRTSSPSFPELDAKITQAEEDLEKEVETLSVIAHRIESLQSRASLTSLASPSLVSK